MSSRKAVFALVTLVLAAARLAAQTPVQVGQWGLSSLTAGSGESPITSGISITADFSKQGSQNLYEIAFQNEEAWLGFGPTFKNARFNGQLVGTIGHFQGSPWAGPRLVVNTALTQDLSFGLVEWPALFAWNPQGSKGQPFNQPIGQYGGISLTTRNLTLSYGVQKFLSNPLNLLPGVSWSMKVSDAFSAVTTGTYNSNASRWLFYIGTTWSPPVLSNKEIVSR